MSVADSLEATDGQSALTISKPAARHSLRVSGGGCAINVNDGGAKHVDIRIKATRNRRRVLRLAPDLCRTYLAAAQRTPVRLRRHRLSPDRGRARVAAGQAAVLRRLPL